MYHLQSVLAALLFSAFACLMSRAQLFPPALILFGDSTNDVGNNNYLQTNLTCNHPPYGKVFPGGVATGRWTDGLTAADYIAQALLLPPPLAYLSPNAKGQNITKGVNFASGGSGLLDSTAALFNVTSFTEQLEQFGDYIQALNESSKISEAFYIISTGTNDYAQNYFQNATLQQQYNPTQFQNLLLQKYDTYLRALYAAGARTIAIAGLAPIGCVPFVINLLGDGSSNCVKNATDYASNYNQGLQSLISTLNSNLTGIKLSYVDVFTPLNNIIQNPFIFGFTQTSTGCCGLGRTNYGPTCNASTPICPNSYYYVFFDAFHPTQHTNQILALKGILGQILPL